MNKTIKEGWSGFKTDVTHLTGNAVLECEKISINLSLKDRIENMKIILRDIELNSNENWVSTRENFYDVDHQCEYLEEQISFLLLQIEATDIRRDI